MINSQNNRICNIVKYMREDGLSQILITSPDSIFYLTGLSVDPGERLFALLLFDDGEMMLFGNELFAIDTENLSFSCKLHKDSDNSLSHLCEETRPGVIGIDKFWPARFLLPFLETRKDCKPILGSSPVDRARMKKDEEEIARMRHASQKNDEVVAAAIRQIQSGMKETDLAAFVGNEYSRLGADFPVGMQIICFGEKASDPHHLPGQTLLTRPGPVLFDIFTPFSHYWCDMTRTVFFQDVSLEERAVYEAVRLANDEAIKAVKPGVSLSEIDKAARDVIAQAGYGKYFTHRLGHGIGIECHESPDISAISSHTAEPGMIFSIEPGIYLPGKTGVRIEDLVLVTPDGCEVLNRHPKDLQIVE